MGEDVRWSEQDGRARQKAWRLVITILLASMASLAPTAVQAQYSYTINPRSTNTITITKYTGSDGVVTIPSTINGKSVTRIGAKAFEGSGVTSVMIPDSVTDIADGGEGSDTRAEYGAFMSCSRLSSVVIGRGVTNIGKYAFFGCESLTSVKMGNSVTSIGEGAFGGCIHLVNFTIPDSVATIGHYAFALTGVTSVTIPEGVISIGDYAFNSDYLTSITIPDSVISIGEEAFHCSGNATSVTIPANVTHIGKAAFDSYKVTAITVDSSNSVYSSMDGVLFDKHRTTLVEYPIGKVGSYTIPAGVTRIADMAFYECDNLTSVTIQDGLTSVGEEAFDICNNLANVSTIPPSVTNIGDSAFGDCMPLTAITVDSSNSVYSSVDGVLFNKSQTTLIQYPSGKAGSYIIPDSVTSIGKGAFSSCRSLTSVTIPKSVTSIEDNAFESGANLAALYFKGDAPRHGQVIFAYWTTNPIVYYLPETTGWKSTYAGRPTKLWKP